MNCKPIARSKIDDVDHIGHVVHLYHSNTGLRSTAQNPDRFPRVVAPQGIGR